MGGKIKLTRREWEWQNGFTKTKRCSNCCFYKRAGCVPTSADDEKDRDKSFCRAMSEDGTEDYFFDSSHLPDRTCCEQWTTDWMPSPSCVQRVGEAAFAAGYKAGLAAATGGDAQ